jgi:hypothetical protein
MQYNFPAWERRRAGGGLRPLPAVFIRAAAAFLFYVYILPFLFRVFLLFPYFLFLSQNPYAILIAENVLRYPGFWADTGEKRYISVTEQERGVV